jgi:hypothetical protein
MTQMEASHEAQKRYGKRAILWSDKKGKRFAIYVRRLSGSNSLKAWAIRGKLPCKTQSADRKITLVV